MLQLAIDSDRTAMLQEPDCTAILRDVEAFGRGPLRQSGQYLAEYFAYPTQAQRWQSQRGHWRATLERLVQSRSAMETPGLWITDNWSCGYYHWICEALVRLELAAATQDLSELTLLLPYKFRGHAYMVQSLVPFGLGHVRFLSRFERVQCSELVFPPNVRSSIEQKSALVQRMRRRFQDHIVAANVPESGPTKPGGPKRVYVSRAMANRRRVKNEPELLPVLRRHGFEILVAEQLDWISQARIFAGAEILVGGHGAGLSNMILMNPASRVLEILDDAQATPACFRNLASAAGHRYDVVEAVQVDRYESVHWSDVVVDPVALDAKLVQVLNDRVPTT